MSRRPRTTSTKKKTAPPSGADKRQSPRAPILTQVEAQGAAANSLGHARDISLGGMLIETPDTLVEGSTVIVRFFLPQDPRPIQAAGLVVRVAAGSSMGIAFLGLRRTDQERVTDYIRSAHGRVNGKPPVPLDAFRLQQRRSARIARRVPVVLSWQDDDGRVQQEAAETQQLSKHGCMVSSFTEMQPGQLLRVTLPERGTQVVARVCWSQSLPSAGRVSLGLEFLGVDDFWQMEFPAHRPDAAAAIADDQRRGLRLPRRVGVVLTWTDEYGRGREQEVETRIISRHGALLACPTGFPLNQRLHLRAPELGRVAEAEVVWVQPGLPGETEVAVEFVTGDDFWGLPFTPEAESSGD